MKKYKVYCGFLDWFVTVEAPNPEMAVVFGKDKMLQRMQEDDDLWAVEVQAEQVHR